MVSASERVICPDCEPVDPGKGSSSTTGEVPLCDRAYKVREIDAAEAEELGFEVSDATAQLEEPIDTRMSWVALSSVGGGVASGYEAETRVLGQLEVESYNYHQLDPELCDGTVCKVDGRTADQAGCAESYVDLRVSGRFETLDGAIIAKFPTQATTTRRLGERANVGVAASADLSRVHGTLEIDPQVPTAHVGRLDLSLQFADSERPGYGVLGVSVIPDWDNLPDGTAPTIPFIFRRYAPIQGQWGEPPFAE